MSISTDLTQIPGIGANMAQHLLTAGYPTIKSLKGQDPEENISKTLLDSRNGQHVVQMCSVLLSVGGSLC